MQRAGANQKGEDDWLKTKEGGGGGEGKILMSCLSSPHPNSLPLSIQNGDI